MKEGKLKKIIKIDWTIFYSKPRIQILGILIFLDIMLLFSVTKEMEKGKKAIHLLGGKLEEVLEYTLPETDIGRSLLLVQKIESTAKKYPRKAGVPSKEPLG